MERLEKEENEQILELPLGQMKDVHGQRRTVEQKHICSRCTFFQNKEKCKKEIIERRGGGEGSDHLESRINLLSCVLLVLHRLRKL
jgi:hypothetical protein